MSDAVCMHLAARVASNGLDQWLALRLQLASAAVVGALAFLAVVSQMLAAPGTCTNLLALKHGRSCCDPRSQTMRVIYDSSQVNFDFVTYAGLVGEHWPALLTGLGLAYALPMVSLLSSLLTSSAEVEQEMVSVERIIQFTHLPSSRTSSRGDIESESVPYHALLTAMQSLLLRFSIILSVCGHFEA